MSENTFDLHKHLSQEHKISPFSEYLKEIVYGGNDGIVTTFAVVAGFAGAQAQNVGNLPVLTVLLFGFANLFADAVSMGLGNFLSSRSEKDVYKNEKKKELYEIRNNPNIEKEESIVLLKNEGFTDEQAKQLVDIYATNEKYWLSFMMNDELKLSNPEEENSLIMAFITAGSFIVFGLTPLIPYILLRDHPDVFMFSILSAATALLLLGALRWKVTHQHPVRSIGETLLLGGTAATIAYLVGTFFRI